MNLRSELTIVAKTTARKLLSILPRIGFVRKPNKRKTGISVIMPVKNEEKWIGPSILSVLPLADEIIVIDSTDEDNTTNIIRKLASKNQKIKHIFLRHEASNSIAVACQIALMTSQYSWILKWEGDCVLRTEAVNEWKNKLSKLDRNRHYVVSLRRVNLSGDLRHQPRDYPFGAPEARLFTFSPELKFDMKITGNTQAEQITGDSIWGHRFPPWYSCITWSEPHIFHCDIKSAKRMLIRLFWNDYMKLQTSELTLEQFAEQKIESSWNMTLQEATRALTLERQKNLMPYDERRFGEFPSILTTDKSYEEIAFGMSPSILVGSDTLETHRTREKTR